MMAEEITGGHMAQIVTGAESGGVGAFAGARRSDERDIHGAGRLPDFKRAARLIAPAGG